MHSESSTQEKTTRSTSQIPAQDAAEGGRRLTLQRPLVAFDLETTGLNVGEDRIVEISCVKIYPNGQREIKTRRVNPEQPISEEACAVHGITMEMVKNEPSFKQVAKSLFLFFSGCDLTGFNLHSFDLPLLVREFERVGMRFPGDGVAVIDSRQIYMMREPRTLSAALNYYCDKELKDAHSAEADAIAAADVLLAQVARYEDLPTEIGALEKAAMPADWAEPSGRLILKDGVTVFGFGRYRQVPLSEVAKKDRDYLEWMLTSDFPFSVKKLVRAHLELAQDSAATPQLG